MQIGWHKYQRKSITFWIPKVRHHGFNCFYTLFSFFECGLSYRKPHERGDGAGQMEDTIRSDEDQMTPMTQEARPAMLNLNLPSPFVPSAVRPPATDSTTPHPTTKYIRTGCQATGAPSSPMPAGSKSRP